MDFFEHFELVPAQLAVRDARSRVRAFDHLPADTVADAELVMSELVANSVMHAGLGPAGVIEVTLRSDRDRLQIVVDDHGRFTRRPRNSRGLGFRILDALCEDWAIGDGRVTATIRLRRREQAQSPARR